MILAVIPLLLIGLVIAGIVTGRWRQSLICLLCLMAVPGLAAFLYLAATDGFAFCIDVYFLIYVFWTIYKLATWNKATTQ